MEVAREATDSTEHCMKTKELYKHENCMRITQICMLPFMKRRRAQSLRHGELEGGSENEMVMNGHDHSDFEIPFFSGMPIIVCNNDIDARHSWRCTDRTFKQAFMSYTPNMRLAYCFAKGKGGRERSLTL